VGTAGYKMKTLLGFAIIFLSICAPDLAGAAQGHYTRSMFERAVKEMSSPRYILCQVRDPRTNSVETVCVPGPALVDAIQIEHDWNYTILGRTKAKGLAMRHWSEPFTFQNSNARARVGPRYTSRQLTEIRGRLSRFTNRELKSQLRRRRSGTTTELQQIWAAKETPISYVSRAAAAHVLLERGILVANDEQTGQLRMP
jgi:hypothetical protein